jgi:transcriptional regulator with XRE-family HTH domain
VTPEELTARREQLGLTQAGLARMLGVPPLTVWKWEHANQAVPPLMEMALRGVQATLEEQPPRRRRRCQPIATPATGEVRG